MIPNLPKIFITGANSQLAQALLHHRLTKNFYMSSATRDQFDICKFTSLPVDCDVVINTAAYTAVDKAEQEKTLAQAINYQGTMKLAQHCYEKKIKLIHISTDYVFDGQQTIAYKETDETNPINIYGETKLQGEQAIQLYHDDYIILRVSGIFSEYGHNFLKTMLSLSNEKKIHVVADQITCPTNAHDIAHVIYQILTSRKTGIYHYGSSPAVSWYEFAKFILGVPPVHPIMSIDYPRPAKRPLFSVLDCTKIKNDFNIMASDWRRAVSNLIGSLAHVST